MKRIILSAALMMLCTFVFATPMLVQLPRSAWVTGMEVHYATASELIATVEANDCPKEATIIDREAWNTHYWLLAHPSGREITTPARWGKLLWTDGRTCLLAADSLPQDEVLAEGIQFAEMTRQTIPMPKALHAPRLTRSRNTADDLVAQVNTDSLAWTVQQLQNFNTRYTYADNHRDVAMWIKQRFESFGLTDVVIDSFTVQGTWQFNVAATLPGSLYPDKYILIGGHHDSTNNYTDPFTVAPGADDNGSGTAASLEMARMILASGWQPPVSIRFCTFAAEEQGLLGANHYAQLLHNQNLDMLMMLNNDMIANSSAGPGSWMLEICPYTGYEYLADLAEQLMDQYTTLVPGDPWVNCGSTDSYYFWTNGFPPIFFIEDEFSPYYHTANDLLSNCNLDFYTEAVKLSAAMMATVADMPSQIANLEIHDVGNGYQLIATWDECTDPTFDHYEIGIGTQPGEYSAYYTTTVPNQLLSALDEGQTYYIGVSAWNISDVQGLITEESGTPQSVPIAPQNLEAQPVPNGVALQWEPNNELDMSAYRVLRGLNPDELTVLQASLTGTSYTDASTEPGVFYWYAVQAMDTSGNISEMSDVLRSRAVTLDEGILVVDDTRNGNGSFLHPTREEESSRWANLLNGVTYATLVTDDMEAVRLDDLAPYSTIIWRMDSADFTSQAADWTDDLALYLGYGGNLLVAGFKPTLAFAGISETPYEYQPGDFCYDWLGIMERNANATARFNCGLATGRFTDLPVDTALIPENLAGHLVHIESISPTPDAGTLYLFGSDYDDGTAYGVLNGLPVGVAKFGESGNVAVLTFPLYYIEQTSARAFLAELLNDHFGEVVATDEHETPAMPARAYLSANAPNPFNPSTVIAWGLAEPANVELAVYNVRGQKVCTLASGQYNSGSYHTPWNGRDETGRACASGLYFYRLQANGQAVGIHKMLMLK